MPLDLTFTIQVRALADESGNYQNSFWSVAQTLTRTATPTPVPTDTPTNTPVPTDTPTNTPVPTNTPTNTPIPSDTPTSAPKDLTAPLELRHTAPRTLAWESIEGATGYRIRWRRATGGAWTFQTLGQVANAIHDVIADSPCRLRSAGAGIGRWQGLRTARTLERRCALHARQTTHRYFYQRADRHACSNEHARANRYARTYRYANAVRSAGTSRARESAPYCRPHSGMGCCAGRERLSTSLGRAGQRLVIRDGGQRSH